MHIHAVDFYHLPTQVLAVFDPGRPHPKLVPKPVEAERKRREVGVGIDPSVAIANHGANPPQAGSDLVFFQLWNRGVELGHGGVELALGHKVERILVLGLDR